MKILQINAVYNLGSTGRCASDFQNYVNANTNHVCETAFCYGGTEKDGYIIGNKLDRKAHALCSRLFGKQGWYSKSATKKLIKYIERYKPDIIQLNNMHGNYVNFPKLIEYVAEKDIPTAVVLHDCWPFTGKCCHYTADRCFKWQSGCYDCPRLKKDNESWFFDRTKFLWSKKKELWNSIPRLAVVGVSRWIVEESKKSPLMSNAKIFSYIYNGIDEEMFKPIKSNVREKYELQNKKIILGVASSWVESKGISDILCLAKQLPEDCKIVLVGNLSEKYQCDEIINIPATSSVQELAQWYSAADVYINMSKEETFGKVSAEALMCGTPVVCFNTTANPELVGPGCGYVCETDSVEEFKKLVMKILDDGKEKYSQSCIEFAKNSFTKEKNIQGFLELYQKLLEM
ncbi:MAG: glycosyltransferase [Clostridia bacterium]|nr:glycosyltransferase [Clostridia bacterium]